MSDFDLDELRSELDEFVVKKPKSGRSIREERIIAGFIDIQNFVDEQGRVPFHGEDGDIFERLYAVRLDRIRALGECRSLLAPFDRQGLLLESECNSSTSAEMMNDDDLLAELEGIAGVTDITELRHVRASADKRAAEEIANRIICEDFKEFKPLFKKVKEEMASGMRETRLFQTMAEIKRNQFFIVGGQIAYVAE
ncbi:MAG: GIY-YIG nuclease family protein, partial [Proteobacteria bacterium]